MNFPSNSVIDLSLEKKNFSIPSFWIYRGLRLMLIPFGKNLSLKIAVRLHWIFRHLANALASNAFGYEYLNSRSAIFQSQFLNKHIMEGDSVVDVACGTARFLPLVLNIRGVEYLGIDSSPKHISRNSANFPNSNFLIGNCLEVSIIPTCDVIILSHFLEHLDNPLDFLNQIKNKCTKLIIEVPDFYSDPINLVSHKLSGPWWTDRDHRREYSMESIVQLMVEANFNIVDKNFAGGTIAVVGMVKR